MSPRASQSEFLHSFCFSSCPGFPQWSSVTRNHKPSSPFPPQAASAVYHSSKTQTGTVCVTMWCMWFCDVWLCDLCVHVVWLCDVCLCDVCVTLCCDYVICAGCVTLWWVCDWYVMCVYVMNDYVIGDVCMDYVRSEVCETVYFFRTRSHVVDWSWTQSFCLHLPNAGDTDLPYHTLLHFLSWMNNIPLYGYKTS